MPSTKAPSAVVLRAQAQRFRQARRELLQLEYFLKGTVLKRMMKCGRPQCACHHDPSKRHGPYFEWTYKVNGKTVNVKPVSYTHLRAHETRHDLVCRLLLEKKKKKKQTSK